MKKRKKRILLASDSAEPFNCGVGVAMRANIAAAEHNGDDVIIVAPEHPGTEECYDVPVIRLPSIRLPARGYRCVFWVTGEYGKKLLIALKWADIVHIHAVSPLSLLVLWLIRKHGIKVKVILHLHTQYDEYAKQMAAKYGKFASWLAVKYETWFTRKCASKADMLVCPSAHYAKQLPRYGIIKKAKIWEAPVWFPMCNSSGSISGDLIKRIRNQNVLVYSGRLAKEKNLVVLFRSFAELCNMQEDFLLIMIGGGEVDFYRAEADRICGIHAGKIIFLGNQDRSDLQWIFNSIKERAKRVAAITLSLTETQGLALLEQIKCGYPAIVLGNTYLEEIISDGRCGIVVQDDVRMIAVSIHVFFSWSDDYYMQVSECGSEYIAMRFDSYAAYDRLQDIYENVLVTG